MEIPAGTPFTLQNLPFGVISTQSNPNPRCAVAITDYAIELALLWEGKDFDGLSPDQNLQSIFTQPNLNAFAVLDFEIRSKVRRYMVELLREDRVPRSYMVALKDVTMHLPMKVGDYSDFYCSLEHCTNCAPMTGGTTPNFFHAPLAYNGRASSIIPSPSPIRRPRGVMYDSGKGEGRPCYGLTKKLDFELEMGFFVSKPVRMGETLNIDNVHEHIFGFVLLNDWSSRDIQSFELRPLGPFNSKGSGTSISPWVVTLDALEPFACRPKHEHSDSTLEHLKWKDLPTGTFDIDLSVSLIRNATTYRIVNSNLRYLYWTPFQQLVQHASAGCGLNTGDLIGTGTISGEKRGELGCLYEATVDGSNFIRMEAGTEIGYLEDDDEIVLDGWCGGTGTEHERVLGFGGCRGKVLAGKVGG